MESGFDLVEHFTGELLSVDFSVCCDIRQNLICCDPIFDNVAKVTNVLDEQKCSDQLPIYVSDSTTKGR